jgi:hypothetical protein
MPIVSLFAAQLWWFALVWALITYFVLWPWSRRLALDARLSMWVAPEMFRVLGVGLLVENLSPGMPAEFGVATAVGDALTATLSVLSFVALRSGWSAARRLTWLSTLVGATDLLIAFPHAKHLGAVEHLAAQWYVPVFAGPIMIVAHGACLVELVRSRAASSA